MKKISPLLFASFMLIGLSVQTNIVYAKRPQKKVSTTVAKDSTKKIKKPTTYEKLFIKDKSCQTSKSDFLTIHKVKSKLYIEMPLKYLGREMLIASTISEASDTDLGVIGYKPTDPIHVKFTMMDSTVFMNEVNIAPLYDTKNEALGKAMARSSLDPMLSSHKIVCYNPDSSAVVLDMTSMFTTDYKSLSPMAKSSGAVSISGSFNAAGSALGEVKVFDDNATIKSYLSYKVKASLLGLILLKNDEPLTYKVTRTILLLPEKTMEPRLADKRLGIFLTNKSQISTEHDMIKRFSVINRWNLQPSDPDAYVRGELVEPVKPITFYLDDAMPDLWKQPAKNGVLRWNKAFEKIGFKNAIRVLDFPKDDPKFDPDNLKYSCIRYVPAAVENAMGPSWVDPRSGEIINASVLVFNDVVKLINQWRFVQTAQVDSRVRGMKLPDDVLQESIEYILAHEVGHCLGFMHNMAASSSVPVDSLRSATFTRKYGTTPSIMDYARFNYVAQPEDKDVKLTPPDLGEYDEFLVKYAYQIVPQKGMYNELPIIRKWIDDKVGNPKYRYGRQQVIVRYDPSALEEDLGDDPIKAADYGVKNLKYILSHLDEWIPDEEDPEATHKEMTYSNIAKQYDRYLTLVMLNIGGVYLSEVHANTDGGPSAVAVPKERQRAAVQWVFNQIKNCDWICDRNITDKFSLRVGMPMIFKYYTTREVLETYKRVILSSHIAGKSGYTPEEYFNDIYKLIWESAIKGRPINETDRLMQRLFVENACSIISKKSTLTKLGMPMAINFYMPSVRQMQALGMDDSGLLDKHFDQLMYAEESMGIGSVASMWAEKLGETHAYGYGWQYRLNLRSLDESKTWFFGECMKIVRLLKSRVNSATGETKSHYQTMINMIEETMFNKN